MARGRTAINIRPDDEIYKRIVALAQRERRSVTNCVNWLLEHHPLLNGASRLNGNGHDKAARVPAVT